MFQMRMNAASPLKSSSDGLEGERWCPLCRCSGAQVASFMFPHGCGISLPLPRRRAEIQCKNLSAFAKHGTGRSASSMTKQ